jgi:hypothetical protein
MVMRVCPIRISPRCASKAKDSNWSARDGTKA